MNRKNAMYLALFSAVSGTAAAAPPTEMDAAPVTTAPQAAKLGAATLQSASLRGGVLPTRVVQLTAPTSAEMGRVRERRIAQVKHGQPLQIGFSRAVTQPTVNLSKLDWQMASDGRAWPVSKSAPHRRRRCVHRWYCVAPVQRLATHPR